MLTTDQIIDQLKQMDEATLVRFWNNIGAEKDWMSIYEDPESINELFSSPLAAVRAVFFGSFNYMYSYYSFNNYGNLVSYNSLDAQESPFCLTELAEHFEEYGFGEFEDEFDISDDDDDDDDDDDSDE